MFDGPDTNGGYTWTCDGIHGGEVATCSADEDRCLDGTTQSGDYDNLTGVNEMCDDGNVIL